MQIFSNADFPSHKQFVHFDIIALLDAAAPA